MAIKILYKNTVYWTPLSPMPATALDPIDALQGQPWPAALWRADQLAQLATPTCPSGFAALDAELPGGGWPQGNLCELLLAGPGQGEWRLLAPALARLTRGEAASPGQTVVCIGAPPAGAGSWRSHGPGLATLGLALPQLLWVAVASPADGAWAAEQALRAGGVGAVIWWAWPAAGQHHGPHDSPQHRTQQGTQHSPGIGLDLRRLHLAAQAGRALLWVLRPQATAAQSSPASLRLACRIEAQAPGRLQVQLLKRRGPPREEPLSLDSTAALGAVLAHRLGQPLPQPRPASLPIPTIPAIPPAPTLPKEPPHARPVVVPAPAAAAAGRPRALA